MDFLNAALGDDTTSEVNGSDSTQDVGYEVGESNVYRGQRMMNAVTRSCLLPVKAKGAVRQALDAFKHAQMMQQELDEALKEDEQTI